MVRSMVLGILMSAVAASSLHAQTPAAQTPPAQPPAEQTPPAQAAAAPATRTFPTDAGLILNFIKPDKTADFEAVMAKLKEGLLKSEKPERKAQAASWKIFKSPDPAGANVLYVFVIDPAVKDADYTISNILAEAFPAEAQALYNQYAGAYAMGQNIVNLTLLLNLGQ